MSCRVLYEPYEVVSRLSELHLPLEQMLEILGQAAGERANVTISDPITTPGTEMWRWATRFLRDDRRLQELGWIKCRHNQIDGIRNDTLEMKLAVITTDACTGMLSKMPRNCADKGPAAERFIKNNIKRDQGSLFGDEDGRDDPIANYDFWYFCVHASAKYVSGEISRPDAIVNKSIRSFSERVIVCKPGDMPGISRRDPVPEDFAEIEKPTIIRKR